MYFSLSAQSWLCPEGASLHDPCETPDLRGTYKNRRNRLLARAALKAPGERTETYYQRWNLLSRDRKGAVLHGILASSSSVCLLQVTHRSRQSGLKPVAD
jgi:hypothetical protein